jgi:OOP family OmpA-OmpF porin
MKMKFRHQALAAVLLASAAQIGFAAASDDTPYMGMMGTYDFPGAPRNLDNGFGATLLFGFPVSDYFAPELTLTGLRARRNTTGELEKSFAGGVNFAIYPFTRNHAVSPFLLVGGGAEHDRHAGGNKTSGYADAGGGLLIALNQSRRAAIRIEGGRYGVFDNTIDPGRGHVLDTRVSAGVQIALGSEAPPPPPPPPTPPVLRDSDGDGVLDDVDQCPGTPRGVVVDSRGCPLPPPAARVTPPMDSDGDGVLDDVDNCPHTPQGMRVDEHGCAIKAAVVVLHDINFEFNKARLTATARQSLDNVAAGLKGQPSMKLEVDGHTDSIGSSAYNLKLSRERAASARSYLIEQGITASRLKSEGFGKSKPIASNKTDEGRAENRRVEFKVLEQ